VFKLRCAVTTGRAWSDEHVHREHFVPVWSWDRDQEGFYVQCKAPVWIQSEYVDCATPQANNVVIAKNASMKWACSGLGAGTDACRDREDVRSITTTIYKVRLVGRTASHDGERDQGC